METVVRPTVIEANLREIVDLAFSPDGATLYAASTDYGVRSWQSRGWRPGLDFTVSGRDVVFTVDVSRNAKRLVTAAAPNTAQIWDTATSALLMEIGGQPAPVTHALANSTGTIVTLTGLDGCVRVFAADGDLLHEIAIGDAPLTTCAQSPSEDTIAVASLDGEIAIVAAGDGQRIETLETGEEMVTRLAFSPRGDALYSIGSAQILRRWDVGDWSLDDDVVLGDRQVFDLALDRNGEHVALAMEHGLAVLETNDHAPVLRAPLPVAQVNAVAFAPDSDQLVVGASDGRIRVFRLPSSTDEDDE